ncbi:TPA: arginine decarboxylase, partial [Escherichia coli]|nr:arginine decarboxylase [Escherichia coli]
CASNDVAVSMMDGNSGLSLTQEVIDEAVDFRQAMARLYKEFTADGSWFFKPWNKEVVTDPQTGKTYDFADAPTKLLTTVQDCWVMHPGESWHGFKDIPDNWSMLDPIKVSILAPGMGEDGELEETGVPAALVTAWLGRHGIVPTRTTDFQIMFLFSMGVTRGKWGTLVNTLCSFKRHYDANTPLAQVMPELVEQYPDTYANMGIHDLGDTMFAWLKENNPGARLNEAYSGLPVAEITPREAYNAIVDNNVELVSIENLPGRIAANSVIPYPPGIPMLLSGENFGDKNSPQVSYLRSLQSWDHHFPGFEHETEGTEIIDGIYHVMCVKA